MVLMGGDVVIDGHSPPRTHGDGGASPLHPERLVVIFGVLNRIVLAREIAFGLRFSLLGVSRIYRAMRICRSD